MSSVCEVSVAWTVFSVLHFTCDLTEGLHSNWIIHYLHDECVEVAIFVPHVLQYKRSTYWRILTLCAWRGRFVQIVPAIKGEWAFLECWGWGCSSCSCQEFQLAEIRYTCLCTLGLEELLVQPLICVQHRFGWLHGNGLCITIGESTAARFDCAEMHL